MKVVLIYNVASGGKYTLDKLKPLLSTHGIETIQSFNIKDIHSSQLDRLIQRGAVVMAIGGDGTLNAVARLLIGTGSILLPLPGGTFNHFVRDLGMAPTLEENLSAIDTAKVKNIDVGYVNGELFLNNSNIGLYPFSIKERKRTKKIFGKWIAAVLSAVDQLVRFRVYKLSIDGMSVRSPFVFVGNNIFDIKSSLVPRRTKLTDEVLTLMVASTKSRIRLLKALLSVAKGDVSNSREMVIDYRERITIRSRRRDLMVSFDGEVKRLTPPLLYSLKPKSLKVMIIKP